MSFLHQKDKHTMNFVPCFRNKAVLPVLFILNSQMTVGKTTVMVRASGKLHCVVPSGVGSFKTGISSYMSTNPSTSSVLLDKVFHSVPKTMCCACCPDLEQGESSNSEKDRGGDSLL